MSKIDDLLKQKADIEVAIANEKKEGKKAAIQEVKAKIKSYGITATDLKGSLKTRKKKATTKKTTTKAASKKTASS